MATVPPLAVVIPCRNEAAHLPGLLATLLAAPALVARVLVVDGGSDDGSATIAALAGATVLRCPANRGLQLARGVAASGEPWLLLLHADVQLPRDWQERLARAIASSTVDGGPAWWFELAIAGPGLALRAVELAVGLRSRCCRLPYGDQGLLLGRALLQRAGGIAPLPLMEDLDLALRLRRCVRLRSLGRALTVSARRWRRLGVWQTTLANARLRRQWRRGVPASQLAARYRQR